ncbi:unnamed protein product, partial [Allacma fusca]
MSKIILLAVLVGTVAAKQLQGLAGSGDPRLTNPVYGPQGYPDQGLLDPRFPGQRFQDQRLGDPRFPDQRLADPRFPDQRLVDPRFQDPRLADPRFPIQRFPDQRLADPRFPDQRFGNARFPGQSYPFQGLNQDPRLPQRFPGQLSGFPRFPAQRFPGQVQGYTPDQTATVVRSNSENNEDGNFRYGYETSNGIQADAEGFVKNPGAYPDEQIQAIIGSYSHYTPDGS